MNEEANAGQSLEESLYRVMLDGVAVHGREEADHGEAGSFGERGELGERARVKRIGHGRAPEAVGVGGDGGSDRFNVSGEARDQHGLGDTVAVEFLDPALGKENGILGGAFPAKDPVNGVEIGLLLLRQEREEAMRKEVNVGVGHRQIAPRSAQPYSPPTAEALIICSRAGGPGSLVKPAARANCVRPATLLTASFFIIVLR